jgi:outer membrane protein insertion porin family
MLKFLVLFSLFLNFSLSAEIIQKLNVKGNSRISEETIKVYGDISIGKNYTNFDIDEMLKNLYKTNFFEDIQIKLNN